MFHLEFFDSEIQEVTNKVQYYQRTRSLGHAGTREDSSLVSFYSEQPQSQDIMYENLVLRAAAFFSGREGNGLL